MTFTIDCGPGTTWKIRVFVWPSHKKLIIERRKIDERSCNDPLAFFHDYTVNRAARAKHWQKSFIGACHFYKGEGVALKNVVHEATHAAVAYAYMCRLNIDTRDGEEEFVKSVEHMTTGILWQLRRKKKK